MSVAAPTVLNDKHDSAKFSEAPREDPVVDFESEGGWVLSRPRHTRRPPTVYSLGFTDISNAEKIVLEELYHSTRGGSDSITGWVHPVTAISHTVRFKKGSMPKYTYRGHGGNHRWDATLVLEEL